MRLETVGIATTTRADFGIYRPLITALVESGVTVHIFAGGTHPLEQFGHTIADIRSVAATLANVHVHEIDHTVAGDQPQEIAAGCGRALEQFAAALARHPVDLLFVLGDRAEMHAVASAAVLSRTPLAHLHGGDTTEGAYDDQFRHAITRLAHLHFPALLHHAELIRGGGEEPWRVHVCGSLAIDLVRTARTCDRKALPFADRLATELPTIVLLFHPETLADETPAAQFTRLATAIDEFQCNVLAIGSNADTGHRDLQTQMQRWCQERQHRAYCPSLTQDQFWNWLRHAAVLVGNSSSGLIEAPTLGCPVVNIGDRQRGRTRAANVIDVPCDTRSIHAALNRAMRPQFRASLSGQPNPWGDGHAAARIMDVLSTLPPTAELLHKKFVLPESADAPSTKPVRPKRTPPVAHSAMTSPKPRRG